MITEYIDIHLSWRDCIEILFFSVFCYYCMLWLMKDRQKNLIFYFFGYCALVAVAYYADLSTIFFLLYLGCPSIAMLFIMVHQEALQKNFIALRTITSPALGIPIDWQELLVRSCLVLLHKQQSVCCVIEQKDSLASFMQTSFIFDTHLQQGLLELLVLGENIKNRNSFIWLTNSGVLKSFDALWAPSIALNKPSDNTTSYWHENAVFFTSKTDAFILSTNHGEGTFSCIVQGKQIDGLTAQQVIRMLHKYTLSREPKKEGNYHAATIQKNQSQHSCP